MAGPKLRIHTGEKKFPTKKKTSTRSKAKAKGKKKRRLTKKEKEFTERWHLALDSIFDAAVEIWGDISDNCWKELAEAADVSYVTVRKLGDRETRFPHHLTIDKLSQAVGGEILIEINNLKEAMIKQRGRLVA